MAEKTITLQKNEPVIVGGRTLKLRAFGFSCPDPYPFIDIIIDGKPWIVIHRPSRIRETPFPGYVVELVSYDPRWDTLCSVPIPDDIKQEVTVKITYPDSAAEKKPNYLIAAVVIIVLLYLLSRK